MKTEEKAEQPPLPYNLLKLQAEASEKFKMSPKEVMEITQNLKGRSPSDYLQPQ
ncbi:DNA topoisomerase [Pseudomonas sp. JG-B]|uniref:DNA topoisomerase n=1 Tax=Pseudomonas sp. JG-B TaxID=2603214 RepID=UPI00129EC8D6